MTQPGHRNEQTGNPALDRIQANVRAFIASLRLVPFLFGGRHVKEIVLVASVPQVVRHGMGHVANGYITTRNYGDTNVSNTFGEAATPLETDSLNEITLVSTVDSTYDVWFF